MVKLDAEPDGGIAFDERFFIDWPKGRLPHQIRLRGRRLLVGFLLLSVRRAAARRRTGGERGAGRSWPWLALAGLGAVPRAQPGHGLAVRGRARAAPPQPARAAAVARADRPRARRRRGRRARGRGGARPLARPRARRRARRAGAPRLGCLARALRPPPARAVRDADRPRRPRRLVVPDRERARRRPDARAGRRCRYALPADRTCLSPARSGPGSRRSACTRR